MPYGEIEAKSMGHGEDLISEPCYKKLKSAEEAYVFPHHGNANFHRKQEKTGNDWVPVTISDVRRHSYPQEDKTKTTNLLKPVHDEMLGNRPDAINSVDSQVLQDTHPPLVSTDDEIYSTSKAFIGPIYKPPEKKKCNERRNQADTVSGIDGKGEREEKQKFNSKKSEIDNELFQFYKEIEELENQKGDSESSCKEPEPSEEQLIPYYQGHNNLLKSEEEKKRDLTSALQSYWGYQQCVGNEPGKYPCNRQVIPTFCDNSFASFRPGWQSMHSFIVPQDPHLPSFNYHLNIQRFNIPPNPSSNIFHAQDGFQMQNGYYVNSCHVNWNCLTFDQNNGYTDCSDITSSDHPSRNGYTVQDEYANNGFCETSEGCWKDPSVDKHNGTDRFMNEHFQEEKLNKLQKLLILLRGLPGSGKTTLSRILLGQSRDGIVFSTDDYFHHQDGYRYNVNQLGDAHDWNQNRAKQAINQGRSPVIIDNTNTQAWEMKPYVEMAIGKGYRIEFHEPETWWKFDPEELEKRNKHGVSRKKIAQMLDRYEYQMSISIVMNSVEPPHKSTQRPPSQGRQRYILNGIVPPAATCHSELVSITKNKMGITHHIQLRERDLKKTGHRFSKAKKRNRKRKKKQNSHSKIMEENSFETLSYLTPEDQDPSQSEEEDLEETKRESACSLTGGLRNEVGDFVNVHKDERQENINSENSLPHVMSVVELDNTPKNFLPKEDDDLFLSLSLMPNESSVSYSTVTQNLPYVASDDCPGTKVEKHIESRDIMALHIQDRFVETPCSFMPKKEMVDKSLLNETSLYHQYGSRTSDKVLRKEQGVNTSKNSYWAFFSNDFSDEELQLGSDRQPYFGSWPEGPNKFICEQRPKRDRWQKLAHPDNRGQLIKLISPSEGASGPGNSPETLIEEKLSIENEDLSPPTENIDSIIETETNIFGSHFLKLDSLKNALHSTKNKKRRQKRIFTLAPNFNLLGQSHINVKEMGKCELLTESHGIKIILEEEKDVISEINNEEIKQNIMTFNHHPSWFYFDIVKDSLLNVGGQFYSHYLLFNRLRHSVYFYKSPIPSLMLQYTSSFWKISFTSKKPFLTFNSQRRVDDKLNDVRFTSSEILSSPPDTLYSFRVTSDLYFLNENFGEKLETWEEPKPLQFSQTEDNQDLTNTDYLDSLELPLSQEFAFQLVKLFGSPGVPVESLLPDDCVVPLDWKTLKMICLQWKTSVEKRQKKIG
ncbi:NEDD4-binding protein 2-like 2 isoform X1 [Physeter macrocephalus]|uniref:NEDD4-binding protein 2-like 2 isoform X1 n=1 Tax=Physeter macrocephalus TaxID=9755 RepID=A0A2Y9EMN0_PHYMC|nr:NEDD4-binding protein 2-like 2 isoform X1 [Physeter catodon]XP_028353293.1 NEDD4-binding protein 2-like 2 isoform X1 [Physeter catodon]XP_028353295.1 NEDD4-binding protein 2-like 2 isoform X1 [Physeter catodon]|eukprot:XP_007105513.2 NEDD4-binding protein 2-like 2 isoform X1 [Physeter catodon]